MDTGVRTPHGRARGLAAEATRQDEMTARDELLGGIVVGVDGFPHRVRPCAGLLGRPG